MAQSNGRSTTSSDDPRPDPTALTTQQLDKAIAGLREILETRMDGADKAVTLLQTTADQFPDRIDEKITSLRDIHEEKFNSIQTQFKERDVRSDGQQKDTKVAVDAALSAADKAAGKQNESLAQAINKSELAMEKRIDQMGQLHITNTGALDDKIDDMKERLTRLEGRGEGGVAKTQMGQQNIALWIAAAAVVVSIAFGFISMNRPPAPAVITAPAVVPVNPNAAK